MRRKLVIALAFVVLAPPVHGASPSAALDRIAQKLASARSSVAGSATHNKCPKDRHPLVGLPQREVRTKLGMPDFVDSDGSWTYFFVGSVLPNQFGGGFPQLTFAFDGAKAVSHLSCYYAR
jgi:hypothetical protein